MQWVPDTSCQHSLLFHLEQFVQLVLEVAVLVLQQLQSSQAPSTVVLFRSGAKGNAHISDSFGTNTGAASHELIQMDSHLLVVRELSIQQEAPQIT